MIERDIMVGLIAIVLGIVILANSFLKRDGEPRLGSMKMIVETFGPIGARIFLAILGTGLLALGVFLLTKSAVKTTQARKLPNDAHANFWNKT